MLRLSRRQVFILSLLVLAAASLACSLGSEASTPAPPPVVNQPAVQPTNPPAAQPPAAQPTSPPPPPQPTNPPAANPPANQPSGGEQYFTETFTEDRLKAYWETYLVGPNAEQDYKVDYSYKGGKFNITIDVEEMYVYLVYAGYEQYDDVALEIQFTNKGVNSQNVGLICRASEDGWYELSVGNDGLWYFYYYDPQEGYQLVYNGGSNNIKAKGTNVYGLTCLGDRAHIFINGREVSGSPINLASYPLTSGAIGLNVSSLGVYPVVVEIDSLKVSAP